MRTEIVHNPFYGALAVTFDRPGEQLVAAATSLIARDGAMDAKTTRTDGDPERTGAPETRRASTTFTATAPGQKLWLAPPADGSIDVVPLLPGAEIYLDARAWLASTAEVALDARWHGAKTFYEADARRSTRVLLRAWGQGEVWFGAYGGFHVLDIGTAHEPMVCDVAHVVAFTHGLQHAVRRIDALAEAGGTGASADGRMAELSGQGRVWLQTRKPSALAAFLHPFRGVGGSRVD